ncbi:acid protease [Microstroma glucosiphilum]|uniref:Acid protease n=1 Tax=Pseudomicrostroma glucosiphilum TaxID=1684307 RepID=A0A316UA84_9BASI|nr:acid protease [Pseudomicrostroma glucosiphilum]PWN22116.1 acid protease [Pseudomicrostroma glucosiphilum]
MAIPPAPRQLRQRRKSLSSLMLLPRILALLVLGSSSLCVASAPLNSQSQPEVQIQLPTREQQQAKQEQQQQHRLNVLHEPVRSVWEHQAGQAKLTARASAVLHHPHEPGTRGRAEWDGAGEGSVRREKWETRGAQDGRSWSYGGSHALRAEDGERDNEWLVEIGYGTPAQKLKVVLDSGSAGGWLYSPSCCYPRDHDYFDPQRSLTFANRTLDEEGKARRATSAVAGTPWNASYGSAKAETFGYVGYDTLQLSSTLQVADVNLALATSLTGPSREKRKMEGLVGLLPSRVVRRDFPGGWNTPFEKAIDDDLLGKPYLSIALQKADRRTGEGGGGSYLFGAVDSKAQRGPLVWMDVQSQTFWGVVFDGLSMGHGEDEYHNVSDPADERRRVVLDTGTALILLSAPAADAVNSRIHGSFKRSATASDDELVALNSTRRDIGGESVVPVANPWLVPCRTGLEEYDLELPPEDRTQPFYISLGRTRFGIPPQDFVFWPNQPYPTSLTGGRKDLCLSAFQPTSAGYSVLGGVFFKNALVVLDNAGGSEQGGSGRKVGVAKRADVVEP